MIINLIVLKWNHCHSAALPVDVAADVYLGLTHNYSSITFSTDLSLSPSNNCGRRHRQFHLSKPNIWHQPCRLNSLKVGKHSIFHHFITIFFSLFFVDVLLLALSVEFTTKETSGFFRWWHIHHTKGVSMIDESVMWWFWTCPVRANALVVVKRLKMPLSLK